MTGEQHLWIEVLFCAVRDAVEGVPSFAAKHVKGRVAATYEARAFLIEDSEDFDLLCDLAGFSPDVVRVRATALIETALAPEELHLCVDSTGAVEATKG